MKQMSMLSDVALDRALKENMKRFDAAAWLHDEAGLIEAISRVCGTSVTSLPRENTFESKDYEYPTFRLTRDDHAILNSIAEADSRVFKAAVHRGLIYPMARSEADALFEHAAARLGFIL